MEKSFDIKRGLEILEKNIKIAPEKPGVYRMLDVQEKVLYVGKAKNIKKRIVAYSHINKLPARLQRMVAQIRRMEFVVVENEAKALLLENELIKKLAPKYNILLKDDKTFPYLSMNMKEDFPVLRKYRGVKKSGYKYFGPFANVLALNNTLDLLQKAFLLRSCSDSNFKNRDRPCLMYQIKRCSAPCVGKISKEDYHKLVDDAVAFLEGKSTKMQQEMSEKMQKASDACDFETAMVFRDRIRALSSVQQGKNVEYANIKSADFVAIYTENNLYCIQLFIIRAGQNCGNMVFFPKQSEGAEEAEVLEAFLSNFYANHQLPEEIVVSQYPDNNDFLQEAFGVKINVYQKGNKAKIIQGVLNNAKEALERKAALETSILKNLENMQKVFLLPSLPKRIEVYDNSHIQGSYAVGAMIVATPEGFDKKAYRTFNIKNSEITNDDFAMMKEVLTRRFDKMTEENRPDVILLDGGLGQLHAVHECLKDYDLRGIAIIAISKGPERNAGKEFYHQMGRESFELPFQSPLAFYMQNIRDEAHRFAIGTHRKKRAKSMFVSKLDEIEGIGADRKKKLLNHFGSAEVVAQAGVSDLQKVSGISKKTAEKIFNYFHK
ncbi:MAG: excinuclease ABC subunit UvrC [Alphaproteobacteria bacterium]|nr:excinuclease ABC subunit UvrC [Alphaproteobacteria bacterium]